MAGNSLVAQGDSLALSREALLIVGGAALGPLGALIGMSAAIGLEARRLQLEGYRLREAAANNQRRYDLQRQALSEAVAQDRARTRLAEKGLEIAGIRAQTERMAVQGSLFIEATRAQSHRHLAEMQAAVAQLRARINAASGLIALDTLSLKQGAALQRVKVASLARHIDHVIDASGRNDSPDLHLAMLDRLVLVFERLEATGSKGTGMIAAATLDQILCLPDLVSADRRAIGRA